LTVSNETVRTEDKCILGDVLESDLVVSHLVDLACVTNGSLDTETVDRVLDDVVVEGDSVDSVVRATTNRANRQTVTAGAEAVLESDALHARSAADQVEFWRHSRFPS